MTTLRTRALVRLAELRRQVAGGARVLAAVWGLALVDGTAAAQAPVLIVSLRSLEFSAVLPGIPKVVDASDPRGGVLEFRGDRTRQVRITLALPTVILTSGGVFMPVIYGTSDGILSTTFDPSSGTRFDPNAVRTACLNRDTGRLFLFLGGRVLPKTTQRRGTYAGTVVATVTYTGAPC